MIEVLDRIFLGVLAVIIAMSPAGCPPEEPETPEAPTAGFYADATSGYAPLKVHFLDTSEPGTSDIDTWTWTFGTGTGSTEQNPAYTYEKTGVYSVSLTVATADGSSTATRTQYIEVLLKRPPAARFTAEPRIGFPELTVQFTDSSLAGTAEITEWLWDFGDGETSEEQNPSHTYLEAGGYTVSLTVASEHGEDTESKFRFVEVTPFVAPTAAFSGDPLIGMTPLSVTFTDESEPGSADIASWAWDFGDGGTSAEASPSHTYTRLGWQTVGLTATSEHGEDTVSKEEYVYTYSDKLTFGGSSADWANAMLQATDGGLLLAGGTQSTGAGGQDMYLVKTDADGNQEWAKTFGGAGDDVASALVMASDGGLLLAGYTTTTAGDLNMYLVRTDASGNRLWAKTYGHDGDEVANALAATLDGGYILAGSITPAENTEGEKQTSEALLDVYLVKVDSTGKLLWSSTFGGEGFDVANSVIEATGGGFVLAGASNSFTAGSAGDAYLLKTDADGALLWQRTFGGTSGDMAYALVEVEEQRLVLAGASVTSEENGLDMYVVKTDAQGQLRWQKTFGGAGDETANAVTVTSDGRLLFAGSTSSFGAGLLDVYAVKTSAAGALQWESTDAEENVYPGISVGGEQADQAFAVLETADGRFVFAGSTESFGAGSLDVYVVKADAEGAQAWFPTEATPVE